MSQFDPVIGADKSGLAYRQDDNNGKKALLTHHKGATPPPYAEAGTLWLDDSATPWQMKFYDGSGWHAFGAAFDLLSSASENTVSHKTLVADSTTLADQTDPTKQAGFDLSNISAGQKRYFGLPDEGGMLALNKQASETEAGFMRKATEAEAIAGIDNEAAMTAQRTAAAIEAMAFGGGLIGYQIFENSGTYDKSVNNPAFVIVEVQGGGGGGGGWSADGLAGGASSFGAHCSGSGGLGGKSNGTQGGLGGAATGGDINRRGQVGSKASTGPTGSGGTGGDSFFGSGGVESTNNLWSPSSYGQAGELGSGGGGYNGGTSAKSCGGGAGGYARKLIPADLLDVTETVTVGAGGIQSSNGRSAGGDGIVIVWEYA